MNSFDTELDWLIKLVPSSERNLKRLYQSIKTPKELKIAVFGKYNHGKSTLLNAICGDEIFKAADKRETTSIQEHKYNGVTWVDTPGLDADTYGNDDSKAMDAAFEIADFIFLVHNVKAGELDKYELDVYEKLTRLDNNYRKKLFLVLTQIDQIPSDEDKQKILNEIKKQLPEMEIFEVSSIRYIRGIKENINKFVALSGMNVLLEHIDNLKNQLKLLKNKEKKRLKRKANLELSTLAWSEERKLITLEHEIEKLRSEFKGAVYKSQQTIAKQAKEMDL